MSESPAESGDPSHERPGTESGDESRGTETQGTWRDVFREAENGLRKFLAGKLQQPADVEDCLQSVFVKALNNKTPVPVAARRAWLFRVAANEAALWWRNKATTDRVLEQHAQTKYEIGTETESVFETKETVERINASIDQLPDDVRTIVRMRLGDAKTFQTIADELQLPLGTVLTKMRRAMQRLRRELDGQPEED